MHSTAEFAKIVLSKCVYARIIYLIFFFLLAEGSLEVKLPTIWTDEKQREESEKRREEKKTEDHKRASLRRKKIQVREKVGKSRNTVFFQ